jgi:hypothetical protein
MAKNPPRVSRQIGEERHRLMWPESAREERRCAAQPWPGDFAPPPQTTGGQQLFEGALYVFFKSIAERAAVFFDAEAQAKYPLFIVSVGSPLLRRPRRALINGQVVEFPTVEAKFGALVNEWRRLRVPGSSVDSMLNEAYGQIVAMGWDAVPLLLQLVHREVGHWYTALTWITGHDPIGKELYGNLRELRRAWLEWGEEHGFLRRNREGGMVQAEPSERAGTRM